MLMRTLGSPSRFVFMMLTCALAASAAPGGAAAQTQPAQVSPNAYSISGWRVECSSRNNVLSCQLVDQVLARANNGVIAGISVLQAGEGKTPTMVVQVPLGVSIADGVRVGIGSNEQLLPFISCYGSGCFARGAIGDPLLSQMRDAKQPLSVSYSTFDGNMNKQNVRITLPLDGFAVAYDKLK
jgi:invasion protein IalB